MRASRGRASHYECCSVPSLGSSPDPRPGSASSRLGCRAVCANWTIVRCGWTRFVGLRIHAKAEFRVVAAKPESGRTDGSARACALAVLIRVFEEGAWADRALHAEARRLGLDARERALAMRLAYGCVQRRATLDHVIEALAERPVERLEPLVRAALRLGVYQLAYADRVPAHAAVGESVELVKRAVPRRGQARQRRAAPRRPRGAGDDRRAARRHPRAGRPQALPPRVGRRVVVGRARPRRGARADGRRQRARRGRAARQHAARRPGGAGGAAARSRPGRRPASPRACCSTARSTRSARRSGSAAS